ncbi:N-acetylglucosamine-6-phosphate deacetylase [Pseudonocardia eucalypti]|uniref:N-acetylglucosamine-6-phosphate deacetylase n=1 Tax=Pseudonocardia eucalypti TaxID=648755 RepID=A0ABP9Q2W0_9PSEU|nr:N-acetylglucosamine-6-phosphate deacetylase [Pseudonocardia eucalypti]
MSLGLVGGDVVTSRGVLPGGWVHVRGDRIVGVGSVDEPPPASGTRVDCAGFTLVPGFVEIHAHGGGGGGYEEGPASVATALATQRAHGTTTSIASLVSLPLPRLRRALGELAEFVRSGELAGVHLEGPWLAGTRCGAHNPAWLRPPEPGEVREVLEAGAGTIRMVTLAPELEGGLAAISTLAGAGVVAAVGHTEADFALTNAAVDAGATVATHLFNAMPAALSREPGPVLALLADPRVTVELIADGVHLHAAWVRQVLAAAGPGRVAMVTDAIAAAGMPDGAYTLGGGHVRVAGGVARMLSNNALAGGVTTSDVLFRRAVQEYGLSVADAARVTATTPAAALGLSDVGQLASGLRADVVLLDSALTVSRVLRAGRWL